MAIEPVETIKNHLPGLEYINFIHNLVDGSIDNVDGAVSLKQIPNAPSSGFADSYSGFDIPLELHSGGAILGTLKLQEQLTGNLELKARRIVAYWPENLTDPTPNVPGTYECRLEFDTLTSLYSGRLYSGGVEGSGVTSWTNVGLFIKTYDGPFFDGDSEPFLYRGELVYPFWNGEPRNSTSSFHWYNLQSYVTPDIWNRQGQKFYETGIDRVVLFAPDTIGVPWNGVSTITESPSGGSPQPFYLDGMKVSNRLQMEEFEATIEAYSAPDQFARCDGSTELYSGLFVSQQVRRQFDFAYRTKVGNDTEGTDHGYKIHLIYNALAEPAERVNKTIGKTVDPSTTSWKITTLPEVISGVKPSAHITIDSRKTLLRHLLSVETILYGDRLSDPRMPSIQELIAIFES